MKFTQQKPAILLLEDGTLMHGNSIGSTGTCGGEICFNTGMTGYQEVYTDPSYFGQIIVNTTPHIGNYGVVDDEQESNHPQISGLIVNDFSLTYSRNTASDSLNSYLQKNNIVGISSVDARKLVRHIRSKGAMNAIISSEILDAEQLSKELKKVPSMDGLELSSKVSVPEPYFLGNEQAQYKVAVLDLGVKTSILNNLIERGCYLKVFNAKTPFNEIQSWGADGYFLSNGLKLSTSNKVPPGH